MGAPAGLACGGGADTDDVTLDADATRPENTDHTQRNDTSQPKCDRDLYFCTSTSILSSVCRSLERSFKLVIFETYRTWWSFHSQFYVKVSGARVQSVG